MTRSIHTTEVGELDVELSLCCPTAVVCEFLQTQFVSPHLYALHRATVVADTNHYGLHLAERGVTHDGDAIVGTVVIVALEQLVERCETETLLLIAFLLEVGEDVEVDVYHVLDRPYGTTIDGREAVVVAFGSQRQGHFVFVEVTLVVGAQAQENTRFAVLQTCDVIHQSIGVNEELQVLVLTHIVVAVLIDSLSIAWRQILNGHRQGLLVLLHELTLTWVGDATDARRQYVVDGLLAAVLLDVDGADGHGSTGGRSLTCVESLFVAAPVAVHEVEGCQTHHH